VSSINFEPRTEGRRRARATLASEAYDELRVAVIDGQLPPGTPLRLEELARQLGMSISPVREAVRLLETQGLAEYAPYRGARVTMLSAKEMAEVYEARAALERVSVRRAAVEFTPEHRAALEDALKKLESAYAESDKVAIVRANSTFHSRIAAASGSHWLERLLSPLLEISERYAAAVIGDGTPEPARVIEARGHAVILAALAANDPDGAEEALKQHFDAFSELLEDRLEPAAAVFADKSGNAGT
jgi:DNA-binding GntR family transcriptional regulator